MNPNKMLWEKGDFTQIAAGMRQSGEAFVESLDVKPEMHVLDLGCGDGTTAIPSAKRGAEVLGVDIASNLVEAGIRRAHQAGLSNIKFQVGDACDLSELSDGRFDLSVSVFGAMFAPKPIQVAKELARVTKAGGRIVMANWIPGDPTLVAQILKISAAYTPAPPEGFISPMMWGVEANIIERFGEAGIPSDSIAFDRKTFTFDFATTPENSVGLFRDYYGPTMNAYDAAARDGKAEDLERELVELFTTHNRSGLNDRTIVDATFLQVSICR
jgi:ubiquinone/menaquinone biosynthesis C-methylase UbiE